MTMKIFQSFRACWLATLALSASIVPGQTAPSTSDNSMLGYIGTYTGAKSKGIYTFRLDSSGSMSAPVLAAETPQPTFVAIHPNQRFLYAANEIGNFQGKKTGAVTAFAIDSKTGQLTFINQKTSGGDGPCHLMVDHKGKNVLVANYGGGSIEALPIGADGSLGEPSSFIQHKGSSVNKGRQEGPHAHFITINKQDNLVLTCDLGLDKVLVYRFDAAKGTLAPKEPPSFWEIKAGSGPRHLAFHPKGPYLYVISEMACTMTVLGYGAALETEYTELQTISTLPPGQELKPSFSTAEVEVHPSGKFLYGSNRGHDSIVVFAIDKVTGKLTHVENQSTQGKTPRHFAIDPSGRYLLAENQGSDTIVVFRIDQKTGRLSPTGQVVEGVGAPVCIKFVTAK